MRPGGGLSGLSGSTPSCEQGGSEVWSEGFLRGAEASLGFLVIACKTLSHAPRFRKGDRAVRKRKYVPFQSSSKSCIQKVKWATVTVPRCQLLHPISMEK